MIGRVAFGCDWFVEDVEAVAVDAVADVGVDVAVDIVEVDAAVADVDGSWIWIYDVDIGWIDANDTAVDSEDEVIVGRSINSLGRMNESTTRDVNERYWNFFQMKRMRAILQQQRSLEKSIPGEFFKS